MLKFVIGELQVSVSGGDCICEAAQINSDSLTSFGT
jgi:hypothetical protein